MTEEIKCPIPLCNKSISKNRKGLLKHIVEKAILSDMVEGVEKKIAENHKFARDELKLNLRVNKNQEEIIKDIKQIGDKFPHQSF